MIGNSVAALEGVGNYNNVKSFLGHLRACNAHGRSDIGILYIRHINGAIASQS